MNNQEQAKDHIQHCDGFGCDFSVTDLLLLESCPHGISFDIECPSCELELLDATAEANRLFWLNEFEERAR